MKSENTKYPQKPGFEIPEDYFRNFEERMMQRLEKENSQGLPAPEGSFGVPNAYFDSLEDRIIDKIGNTDKPVIRLWKRESLFYAAAVAALCILMLGNFFRMETEGSLGWDDIEVSAIENYIDEGYEMGYIDLSYSDYSDLMASDGKLIDESHFNTINSEAALDYIDENIEDPTFILE